MVNIETATTHHRDRGIVPIICDRLTLHRQSFQNSKEPYFQSLSIPTTWVVVSRSVDL